MRLSRAAALATILPAFALGLSACGGGGETADVENGKVVFQKACAGCHALADAGPAGVASSLKAGPNLDDAFRGSREHGFKASQFESLVNYWIEKAPQKPWRISPQGVGGKPAMARDIVDGQDQADVAAYVAQFAGTKDVSAVVPIPAPRATAPEGSAANPAEPTPAPGPPPEPPPAPATPAPATAGGVVDVTADPTGALAFVQSSLDAAAGKVKFNFTNPSALPHNFAIREPGGTAILAQSETVQDGGVATIEADLKPGTYEYFCAIPGHEAMKGTLYVTDAANQGAPVVKGPRIVGPWVSARLRDRRIGQLKPATKAKASPIDSYSLPGYWIRILP